MLQLKWDKKMYTWCPEVVSVFSAAFDYANIQIKIKNKSGRK